MAELYLQQGQLARAIAIYRKVVRDQPADNGALDRLSELEGTLALKRGAEMVFAEQTRGFAGKVPGTVCCAIMGFDGIPIDTYEVGGGTLDIGALLTEYSAIAKQLLEVGDRQPEIGEIKELTITSRGLTTLVTALSPEFFVAAVLGPEAMVGRARYELRMMAPDVLKELE